MTGDPFPPDLAPDVPEADAVEHQWPADPYGPDAPVPHLDLEAPEADAIDQQLPVGRETVRDTPSIGAEVPEADAIEQSLGAPPPDDDYV